MNSNYLMSILDLYLNKEKEYKTYLCVTKYVSEKIKFDFKMNNSESLDTTSFFLEYDKVMTNEVLTEMFDKFKQNLIIIDEKYEYDKLHKLCYYNVQFSNGRSLVFKNFTLEEINNIRNLLYDVKFNLNEININDDLEEKQGYYHNYRLSESGFTGYLSILLIALVLVNIFIVALWIFKNFI